MTYPNPSEPPMHDPRVQTYLESAMDQLLARCVLVDVRDPVEFAAGHVPGSINVPLGELDARMGAVVDQAWGRDVALVSEVSDRAQMARQQMADACFSLKTHGAVHILEGGLQEWERRGMPVEIGSAG